jgi:hypothetical protein
MLSGLYEYTNLFRNILSKVEYNGELSAVAYIILACAIFIMIGGLGWCFYRALMAGGQEAPQQHPDEVGDENKQ